MRTILLVLMLLSCNLQNNRNCLILDAFLGLATVLTVRKILTVGYLLLTVISFWIFLSDSYILLDISFCNCNITYALWIFVSESWLFVSEKAISKIFTLPLLHICIQREKDQCCVLFMGIFYAGMPGSNLGSCHSPRQMER